MIMKNYLRKFEFFSGLYESIFFQQFYADDEKDAILQTISMFTDKDEEIANNYILDSINFRKEEEITEWSTSDFWEFCDMKFSSDTEGYDLMYIKEIDTNLDKL